MVVKIQKKKYFVPTSWNDVNCGTFQKLLLTKDIFERISVLTGISKEVVENLDWQSVQVIQAAISFSTDFSLLTGVYPKEFESFDISKQPAHTILAVQGVIQAAKPLTDDEMLLHLYCGVDILNIYITEAKKNQDIKVDIYNEPITDWYGLMCFFLSKWVAFSINSALCLITNRANTNSKRVSRNYQISRPILALLSRLWKSSNKRQITS